MLTATVLVVHNTLRTVLIVRRAPKTSKVQIASVLQAARYYRPRGSFASEPPARARAQLCLDSLAPAASAALRLAYSIRAAAAA